MNDQKALERRVAALIRAYADRAPIDVDPTAMTLLVAAGPRRSSPWIGFAPGRALVFTLVLLALLGTIAAGALLAGGQLFRRDPIEILTDRVLVEPFIGLPPEGVAPSTPETGRLILSFNGRVQSIALDFHRVWVFADGRVIWKRNLDGMNDAGRRAFGSREPTTAVIEQRLTAEGIELIRSRVLAAGLHDIEPVGASTDPTALDRPGVLWGGLVVHDGERLVWADWSDSQMPALLADPASWIPATAWEDRRIGAYVPSRYAVCLQRSGPEGATAMAAAEVWDVLPEPTRNLIRSSALEDPVPNWDEKDPRCLYQVSTDDARAITAALDDAGLTEGIPIDDASSRGERLVGEGRVELLMVLPNGEVICNCG